MHHGFQALMAISVLTTLSHFATAQSETLAERGLQFTSRELVTTPPTAGGGSLQGSESGGSQSPNTGGPNPESVGLADLAEIEFTVRGGQPLARAWVVGVDEPRLLVAIRARLEGNLAGPAPVGERDVWRVQFDTRGEWSAVHGQEELRSWMQVIASDGAGGFEFSDLTRGVRPSSGGSTHGGSQSSFLGSAPLHQSGEVVISEFLKDPAQVSDTAGEWVEVTNGALHRINLEGVVISDDGSNGHLIFNGGSGLWFLPGRRLVLGRNTDTALNGGVEVDYAYSSFTLGNSADQIVLTGPTGRLIDRIEYDNGVLWPDSSGASISLAPGMEDPYLNDDAASWCHSVSPMTPTSSDSGTPGAPNDVCP